MKQPSLFKLGLTLMFLHVLGFRPVPGYTLTQRGEDGLLLAVMMEQA